MHGDLLIHSYNQSITSCHTPSSILPCRASKNAIFLIFELPIAIARLLDPGGSQAIISTDSFSPTSPENHDSTRRNRRPDVNSEAPGTATVGYSCGLLPHPLLHFPRSHRPDCALISMYLTSAPECPPHGKSWAGHGWGLGASRRCRLGRGGVRSVNLAAGLSECQ